MSRRVKRDLLHRPKQTHFLLQHSSSDVRLTTPGKTVGVSLLRRLNRHTQTDGIESQQRRVNFHWLIRRENRGRDEALTHLIAFEMRLAVISSDSQ